MIKSGLKKKMSDQSSAEEMVTITKKEYLSLLDDQSWRAALEDGGVDNWEWYHESLVQGGYFDEEDE